MTWEQVLDAYGDVDQKYFLAVLSIALAKYDALVSKWSGYQDGEISGAKLVARALAGDQTWPYMGAAGGLSGQRVTSTIADGSWETTAFQCRHQELPGNRNWFSVSAFIEALRTAGVDVDALKPASEA